GDLPRRLWLRMLELSNISTKIWGETSDSSLHQLAASIHNGQYTFDGKGEFKEEFVTCGGVDLTELELKHFRSKMHPRLYFAGEILDVDGITGGFNFQHAWTSSRLAATAMIN